MKFPAGCELYEALGPASLKGSKYFDLLAQVNHYMKIVDIPHAINTSQLTSESLPEHLLSMQYAISSGKTPEASIHNVHTINHPSLVKEDKHHCLSSSSGICGVMSCKGVSSTCPGACSEQLERSSEPSKNSKKRARPGKSCRPRPRDRQLFQCPC
ncbi:bHLH transcription factor-like protein [Trifolium medium]|uniref:BHLH transcription factor-like protein n=1 Tax=Trifolium medium TaxID=97028 RepID=A0A392NAB7_9FABA|nr:bHLH transcription factor-like protein [Trifolium medium]